MDWTELIKYSYEYVWIIPLLPLLAFMLIIIDKICERLSYKQLFTNNKTVAAIVVGSTAFGLIQALLIFLGSINGFASTEFNFTWLNAGNLTLSFGWLIDNLCIKMMLIVTSISMLIQIYTHGYMKKDPGYRLFYGYLALFNFSMLGLVLSTNLFQIYIFWELVGVSSYLLIGFWMHKPSAAKAAKKAFIVNRIGDSLFLIGILGFLYFSYTYWVGADYVFLSFTHLINAVDQALFSAGPVVFAALAICLFFGAVAKSAQFPLHTWLPDAMEGPTPISALIHAATMVAAGVFLVARCYPIFVASPFTMNFIAWIGAITVLIGATIALTQFDIKRVLAYSTISQLGYMMFAMGMGAYSAGLFHLTTHAYFKALLFLCSGAVIIGLHHEQDMRYMGGLRKHMPITAYTYLVGVFAISGILFSGFFSKDLILGNALHQVTANGSIDYNILALFTIAFISAGLTALYMFRSYFMTFEGKYRGHAKPHEAPKVMVYPLIVLAVPSAFIGLLLAGPIFGIQLPDFTTYIYYLEHHPHTPDVGMMVASLLIASAGAVLAITLYWDKYKSLDPEAIKNKIKPLYNFSYNKWYFDEAYDCVITRSFMWLSKLSALFDKYVIDEIVNLTALITKELGATFKYIQNGKVQFSALVMYTGLVIISIVLVVYSLI